MATIPLYHRDPFSHVFEEWWIITHGLAKPKLQAHPKPSNKPFSVASLLNRLKYIQKLTKFDIQIPYSDMVQKVAISHTSSS